MRRKLRAWFAENLGLKLIALAIGFLIWLFVTNSNDPVRTILISNVPITITNENSIADIGKVVEPEGSGTVTLRVTERESVLSRLSRTGSDFSVVADLQNITEMNTVPLTVTCSNAAVTWDEVDVSPSALKVTLEDKVEQAFSVSVIASGSPASGYAVGTTEVKEGKTILLDGPASLIHIIDKVTAPVSVAGLSSDATLSSTLKVYDKNGSELTESQMGRLEFKTSSGASLTDHIVSVITDMWKVKSDIRLEVETSGETAEGYRVGAITTIPETISLAGSDEALEKLGGVLKLADVISVQDADGDIQQEIDLTDTLENETGLKLLADMDPTVTVNVTIEKTGDVSFDVPLSDITFENAPENMKLVFTPADKISIGVHADGTASKALTKGQIQVSVDLSACSEEGTYEIPAQVELPEGYELSSEVILTVSASSISSEQSGAQTEGKSEPGAQTEADTGKKNS